MKKRIMCLICGGLAASAAWAQEPAAPAAPVPPTAEQLQRGLQVLQQRIELKKETLAELQTRMIALDDSIEKRIDRLLKQMASIKDSADSKTRLANLKEDVLAGLQKILAFYKQERDRRMAAFNQAYSTLTKEQLEADIKTLEKRGEFRVNQIVELAASLPGDKDYQQYDAYRALDPGHPARSQRDQHASRQASHATGVQKNLIEEARKAIEDIQRQNRMLEQALPTKQDEAEKQFLRDQIAYNNELMARRHDQVANLISADGAGADRALGRQEAFQLEQLVHEMMAGLRRDMSTLRSLIYERDQVRVQLNGLEAQQRQWQAMEEAAAPAARP